MAIKDNRIKIYVYGDWKELKGPILLGALYVETIKGDNIFSFEYNKDWINTDFRTILDPDLQLYPGPQYLRDEKRNFGIFMDSSPDRWGKLLMNRMEALIARNENRAPKKLREVDYLLGVYDEYRMGALRFKLDPDGEFMNNDKRLAIPPWAMLGNLEEASLQLEKEGAFEDPEYQKWLNMLIGPGSSIGGARPKAGILDNNNHLLIAKFPSREDIRDIGGWEGVVNRLAKFSGINVADGYARKFSGKYHTFLTKRFDRTNNRERIHFASAMTLLGYTDHPDDVSYIEIAEFLLRNGANINENLEELWRRIVFNICVSNTDDHLRNHGFLLTEYGWELSPAYDINPTVDGIGLRLNITEHDNSLNLDLVIEIIGYFRIKEEKALKIISQVKSAVSKYREIAKDYGISKEELEIMSTAFNKK